eukprot:TRINITY_DN1337_c0_g1_i4.p2 TRINITY_DN1337_c0_g1~~TRINITY_DN1337_c0_g1_i4.p2  ORF type:complete len:120 (-),score=37.85 TRINITY_DN1337_c0_g1_i4:121-480(-)
MQREKEKGIAILNNDVALCQDVPLQVSTQISEAQAHSKPTFEPSPSSNVILEITSEIVSEITTESPQQSVETQERSCIVEKEKEQLIVEQDPLFLQLDNELRELALRRRLLELMKKDEK